jgi:hypothetical protein
MLEIIRVMEEKKQGEVIRDRKDGVVLDAFIGVMESLVFSFNKVTGVETFMMAVK